MDKYKQINTEENYTKLLNSGMFWEFHPELTGTWEVDKKLILPDVVVPKGTLCKCGGKLYKQRLFNMDWNTCEKCGISKLA